MKNRLVSRLLHNALFLLVVVAASLAGGLAATVSVLFALGAWPPIVEMDRFVLPEGHEHSTLVRQILDLAIYASGLCVAIGTFIFLTFARWKELRTNTLLFLRNWRWEIFATSVAFSTIAIVVASLAMSYPLRMVIHSEYATVSTTLYIVLFIFLLGAMAFSEEVLFRSWIPDMVTSAGVKQLGAAVISTVAFVSLHLPGDFFEASALAVFGLGAWIATRFSGGLEIAVAAHLVSNVIAIYTLNSGVSTGNSDGTMSTVIFEMSWISMLFVMLLAYRFVARALVVKPS